MASRRLPVLVPVLVLVLAASGCAFFGEGADARKDAEAFARALEKGDAARMRFTDASARPAYVAAAKPLAGLPTKVRVDQVTRSGSEASVRLAWDVDVRGHHWKHTTHATLVEGEKHWSVRWKPSILASGLGTDERLQVSTVVAQRGDILGAGDAPIVTERPVVRFGIDKATAPPASVAASARRLAQLLGVDPAPYAAQVAKAGPRAFVPAIVLRREAVTSRLLGRVTAIPGGRGISDHVPLAPSRDFAPGLLGSVGPVTKEIVDKSDGRLRAGDDAGLSGLELRYDEQLFGKPGVKVSIVPADKASEPTVLFEADAEPGKPLRTTLDVRLQAKAQQLLAHVAPASALVALRPSTGDILVAASGPGSKGQNTATFGRYAPGSTFKVVSSLALLRSGLSPASPVTCPPSVTVNGKGFKNYDDYPAGKVGRITLREAVANSCNTAFIGQRERVTGSALADAAAALGFGVDHDLGFPSFFGQVPAPAGDTEAAADLIGQGKVLASPMAMAAVVGSVVRGQTVVPRLLPDLDTPKADPAHPLTATEAGQLRGLMRAVVQEGSGSFLRALQPPPVLAKTGTAEYGDKPPLPTHAWMVGAQGDLAVAVFVETGQSGSRTAGPILEAFLRAAR